MECVSPTIQTATNERIDWSDEEGNMGLQHEHPPKVKAKTYLRVVQCLPRSHVDRFVEQCQFFR